MFYNDSMLTRKGPLAHIWMAAHYEKKLTRHQIVQTNIEDSVRDMVEGSLGPMALRLSGQLLLGVTKIYGRKTRYLLDDCSESLDRLRMSLSKVGGDTENEDDSYSKLLNPNLNSLKELEKNSNITLPTPTLNFLSSHETPELDLDALLRGAPLPPLNTTGFTQGNSLDSIEYARRESYLSMNSPPQQPSPHQESSLNPLNFSSEIEFARRQSSLGTLLMMDSDNDNGDFLHLPATTSSPQSKLAFGLKMVNLGQHSEFDDFEKATDSTLSTTLEVPKIKKAKRTHKQQIKLDKQTILPLAPSSQSITPDNLLLNYPLSIQENSISLMLEDDIFLSHRHSTLNYSSSSNPSIASRGKKQRIINDYKEEEEYLPSIVECDNEDFDHHHSPIDDPSSIPTSPYCFGNGTFSTHPNNNLHLWKNLLKKEISFKDFIDQEQQSFTPIENRLASKKFVSSLFMDLLVLKTNGHLDLVQRDDKSIIFSPKESLFLLETI